MFLITTPMNRLEMITLIAAIAAAVSIPPVCVLAHRVRRRFGRALHFVPITTPPRVCLVWIAPLTAVALCWLVNGLYAAPVSTVAAYLVITGAAVAWTAVCHGGRLNLTELELREHGLCHGLWSVAWDDILEYTWQPSVSELVIVARRGTRVFRINNRHDSSAIARWMHLSVRAGAAVDRHDMRADERARHWAPPRRHSLQPTISSIVPEEIGW